MNDPIFDNAFEDQLRSHHPTAPAISQSEIMFESGRAYEQNRFEKVHRRLKLWRNVAACSLLATACSFAGMLHFANTDNSSIAESQIAGSRISESQQKQIEADSQTDAQPRQSVAQLDSSGPLQDLSQDLSQANISVFSYLLPDPTVSRAGRHFQKITEGIDGLVHRNLATAPLLSNPLVVSPYIDQLN